MSIEYPEVGKSARKIVQDIVNGTDNFRLYEKSVHEVNDVIYFMVRDHIEKFLVILFDRQEEVEGFSGERSHINGQNMLICPLDHENAESLRSRFEFTRPVLVGKGNSYGFGDRLGNAGPAHLRAVKGTGFRPVLAQQSIRELTRTRRTAEEVLDAATWSVFQEGFREGFGADGDHLKTTSDIDLMVKAGYTMFTIDPSEYVRNEVVRLPGEELLEMYRALPWDELEDSPDHLLSRLSSLEIDLADGYRLSPSREEVLQGMVKYGRVIAHTRSLSGYLAEAWPGHPAELELSVDETDEPTTLFEHYLIASELYRLGVELVSLAPRFCGDFEKGIDFRGDLDQFRDEYIQHLAIAARFGGYKLSIHSGSDKFSVYEVIGSLDRGAVHVKTAGTSYLEALRTVAEVDPDFFRQIMRFSAGRFEEDRKTYHISAELSRISDPEELSDDRLKRLLDDEDARQVLHVAYGSVLSGEQPEAAGFKARIMELLESNESLHEENLLRHFKKHLDPFL